MDTNVKRINSVMQLTKDITIGELVFPKGSCVNITLWNFDGHQGIGSAKGYTGIYLHENDIEEVGSNIENELQEAMNHRGNILLPEQTDRIQFVEMKIKK
jgi:hypothetical protein